MLPILCLLAAFSGETRSLPAKPSFTQQRFTACALVTRADVERALGRTVDSGSEENDARSSTCDYSTKEGLVSIAIQKLTARPDRKVETAALAKEIPEGSVREARGFADAFFFDVPEAGTQLHVLFGDRGHLMVSILGFGEASQVSAAAEQIARKAIGRL